MIDRRGRKVHTAGGTTVDYRALVLATGSTPTRLPIDGADLPGVIHVRDREQRVELLHRTFPSAHGLDAEARIHRWHLATVWNAGGS